MRKNMELNELKLAWAEYDRKLSERLVLNKSFLRSFHLEKYSDALRKPVALELINIVIQAGMAGFATVCAISLSDDIRYLLAGLAGALLCISSLALSAYKVVRFNSLVRFDTGIIDYQKNLMRLRLFIMRLRKTEYIGAPILGITLFPVIIRVTSGTDIIGNLTVIIPWLAVALGSGIALGVWLNMRVYDKGIRDAEMFLELIAAFENENEAG
jgi:hypothetical protein